MFAHLSQDGLIEARPGQGTFVRLAPEEGTGQADLSWQSVALGTGRFDGEFMSGLLTLPPPGSIPLSMGYLPPDLQATSLLSAALRQAAARPELWDRLPVEGLENLRAWFAREVGSGRVFLPH